MDIEQRLNRLSRHVTLTHQDDLLAIRAEIERLRAEVERNK